MACLTNYCVSCTDVASGETGDFLFDIPHWQLTGEFKAISPVFNGLVDFFNWCHANGNPHKGIYIERLENES